MYMNILKNRYMSTRSMYERYELYLKYSNDVPHSTYVQFHKYFDGNIS